jgi:hypothetical protein
MVHSFWRAANKNFARDTAHGGDAETMLPLAVEQGHRRPARNAVAMSAAAGDATAGLRDVECAARRAESLAHAARRAWLGASDEDDLAAELRE